MTRLNALCVYCGSVAADSRHEAAARALGHSAAKRRVDIVFGGGRVGLMGAVAEAALEAGGRVIGIIPEFLVRREAGFREITEMVVVDSMHTRKREMFERADAFCVLPGGLGTLDETFEILTWKQLALHDKPIVLINLEGFWDPLMAMIRHQAAVGEVRPDNLELVTVVESVEAVFEAVARAPTPCRPARPGRV